MAIEGKEAVFMSNAYKILLAIVAACTWLRLTRRPPLEAVKPDPAAVAFKDFAAQQSRQDRQNAVEYIKQLFQLLAGAATLLSSAIIGLKAFSPRNNASWIVFVALAVALVSLALGIGCNFFMFRAKQEFGFYWEMRFHGRHEPWIEAIMDRGKRRQSVGIWLLALGFAAFVAAAAMAMWFASESLFQSKAARGNTAILQVDYRVIQLRSAVEEHFMQPVHGRAWLGIVAGEEVERGASGFRAPPPTPRIG